MNTFLNERNTLFSIIDKVLETKLSFILKKPSQYTLSSFRSLIFQICADHPRRKEISIAVQTRAETLTVQTKTRPVIPISSSPGMTISQTYQYFTSLISPDEDIFLSSHIMEESENFQFSLRVACSENPELRPDFLTFIHLFFLFKRKPPSSCSSNEGEL